jgi:hypothetical protein
VAEVRASAFMALGEGRGRVREAEERRWDGGGTVRPWEGGWLEVGGDADWWAPSVSR